MSAWLDYTLGVSQNLVASGLTVTWHHRRVVVPLKRELAKRKECGCAEEAGTQAQGGGEAEGPR